MILNDKPQIFLNCKIHMNLSCRWDGEHYRWEHHVPYGLCIKKLCQNPMVLLGGDERSKK